jgi:hypothetical protein
MAKAKQFLNLLLVLLSSTKLKQQATPSPKILLSSLVCKHHRPSLTLLLMLVHLSPMAIQTRRTPARLQTRRTPARLIPVRPLFFKTRIPHP